MKKSIAMNRIVEPSKKKIRKISYPKIIKDKNNNFLSIKLKPGVEAKSYSKKGIVFSEEESGNFIEVQIINF